MARAYCHREVLPFAAMIGAECVNVGLNILFKAATLRGMSYNIFSTYSFAISTIVLIPFLFIFPSTAVLPSFKLPLVSRICLLVFAGSFGKILGYKGIGYSSPTLSSAISNLVPAFTFILAIIFSCYECFVPRGCSVSWKCDWSSNNIHWVLCCDMGKSKRSNGG
ncbi:hypothetical protein SLEP1_g10146 [Rubroshorea leprosula]|uniref:WAT1-related protein n=1 Tax=Rubroshorea leprosula TaxID=152421 RepID=A0AAV5IH38_9ROSI|nr:hypothetical protein SLEP1_g10146 [Rubroshorea leprosula]